jgi:polysaccharide chain length determinant protein (PEP-CTERM system associated)
LVLGIAGAVAGSRFLVDKYRSETLIMVVPQRIPDSYVKSTVTAKIEDRLPGISQQILSRSRLERIITDLALYPEERRTGIMEDVVQRMRNDIQVGIEKGDSFRVSYVSHDAKTAQKVTERLASLFIEESLRDRENLAEDTNQFLDSQLEDARRRLIEHEKKLEDYRRRFSGELPTQATANLQAIQTTQLQLQSLADAMDRERERRLLIERQLADLQSSPDPVIALPAPAPGSADVVPVEPTAQQLESARARLHLLEARLKPDHPDVRMVQKVIRDLEAKERAELRMPAPAEPKPERPQTLAELSRQRRIRDLKAQIDDLDKNLQEKQQLEKERRAVVAQYQARLDAIPTRESELVELTRDYTTLQTAYQSLLTKREDSKLAANLERRNIGEQFKVLDPAKIPERPFSPNRRLIYAGGAGGGLALAILIAAFEEYRDSTLKREADVVRLFDLPVLALVPIMTSPWERRSRRRRIVFAGIAVCVMVLGAAAAFVVWRLRF